MIKIGNPQPIFLDDRGLLSDGGYVYVGQASADPELSPITLYWDTAMTIVAQQPLRTVGGLIVNGATPAAVFSSANDYSMRLRDSDGTETFYSPSVFNNTDNFQPLSLDLTGIAALTTTAFGRNLLTLANQAALASATGIPNPLPAAGGTMTGSITRSSSGVYVYFADAAMTSGRIFVTASGASDPTSQPGDIWLQKQ